MTYQISFSGGLGSGITALIAYERGMAVMDGTACFLKDKPIGEG